MTFEWVSRLLRLKGSAEECGGYITIVYGRDGSPIVLHDPLGDFDGGAKASDLAVADVSMHEEDDHLDGGDFLPGLFNPANGLPMLGGGVIDIHGNHFGGDGDFGASNDEIF